MVGKAESGWIACTPLPGMLNSMESSTPALRLESRIACRSEPSPLSRELMTVRVAGAVRSSRISSQGWKCRRAGAWERAHRGRDDRNMAGFPFLVKGADRFGNILALSKYRP